MAYFFAFGIFVPTALHMIVYDLYLLRTYLSKHVATDVAAKEKRNRTLMYKLPLRAKSMISLTGKPSPEAGLQKQPTPEKDQRAISAVKRSPSPSVSGQANVLKFESNSEGGGRKVRLKSVFDGATEMRRRSRLPSHSQLSAVMSEEVTATVKEHSERADRSPAESPASSKGNKAEELTSVHYF